MKTLKGTMGRTELEDPLFFQLVQMLQPKTFTPPSADLVELPSTPSRNQMEFLRQHLPGLDLIIYIFGVFQNPQVSNPQEALQKDFIFADSELVEHILSNLEKLVSKGQKERAPEWKFFQRVQEHLRQGKPIREMTLSREERHLLSAYPLLSALPIVYLLNVTDEQVKDFLPLKRENLYVASIRLEKELSELEETERASFLQAYGLDEFLLPELKRKIPVLSRHIFFYTIVGDDCRAWDIPENSTALEAAGRIHTDFARGFVKAEVLSATDFLRAGSLSEARNLGFVHLEGKDYPVKYGDILTVRFAKV
ncbi:MAG: DUF933 domain-containing protein [bacterium JZ-2024 1]